MTLVQIFILTGPRTLNICGKTCYFPLRLEPEATSLRCALSLVLPGGRTLPWIPPEGAAGNLEADQYSRTLS